MLISDRISWFKGGVRRPWTIHERSLYFSTKFEYDGSIPKTGGKEGGRGKYQPGRENSVIQATQVNSSEKLPDIRATLARRGVFV
ncbi:MAG: hypothetical protein A3G59_00995 [Candidatus Taylorbacteria bacterium RIFCSPLOWO2_12_FULL_47_20]|uniref:Uncharacterized protein n=2 Tax=Candidatus Tayloriibacteriota TaxID=1817919 RepID=A0A1G2P8S9_9BACT|nr:MAG: hypothetical protein A3H68_00295 [Candidatus Taylorbacteria bacterium RIFCSPLOWO2_02_FULL_46_40]OHA44730.1 MAG: hypothetical protein A3G59_00995 [Candidatus Taylorbacteria bacterium RIFCSPLOWO2_12_FULL_47_20]